MIKPRKCGLVLAKKCKEMNEALNITRKAKALIEINSVTWLSDKLGVTRVTLYERIKKENWKKLEIEKLSKL